MIGSGGWLRDSGVGNIKLLFLMFFFFGNLWIICYMSENGFNSVRLVVEVSSMKVDEFMIVIKEENKDKKKRKKGMKGWVWVVEDENGNVIDLLSDEEIVFWNVVNNE